MEITDVLISIRNGTIASKIPNYVDIEVSGNESDVFKTIMQYHRAKSILPVLDDIAGPLGFCDSTVKKHCDTLVEKSVVYELTTRDIFGVFGYYENGKPKLPKNLHDATKCEIDRLDRRILEARSYRGLNEFYLALVKTGGIPVFQNIFNSPVPQVVSA